MSKWRVHKRQSSPEPNMMRESPADGGEELLLHAAANAARAHSSRVIGKRGHAALAGIAAKNARQ
jgi:hypothetical protein